MRHRCALSACAAAVLLLAGALWQIASTTADPPQDEKPAAGANGPAKPVESPLPIRQVVLFNSGVGYFQHEGEVQGNTRVEMSFPASEINDLLKSLILQDSSGGKVSAVQYDSHDPIEKTLRSFAIDLSMNPTFGQVLNQARGEKIEVMRRGPKDTPVKLAGTIVGMEASTRAIGDAAGKTEVRETELLNLATADGLRTVPLAEVQSLRFLSPTLEREFHRALAVLARAHDVQKKTVSVGFQGNGKRNVRVGYVVERPIWKTTYRLRIDGNNKVFLQAWALVENTSDDDWTDVRMVLVSGKPISYKMNLYEPLYIPRPTVEPEMFAPLRPPGYDGELNPPRREQAVELNQQPGVGVIGGAGMMGMFGAGPPGLPGPTTQVGQFGQFGGGGFGGNFTGGSFQGGGGQFGQFGGGQFGQFGGGQFGQFGGNRYQGVGAAPNYLNAKLTYEQLQARRKALEEARDEARKVGGSVAMNFKEGIASVAESSEVGDYYQYTLDQKISLPRQKSAMLPIINAGIQGTKVSIFNQTVHAKYPLLGLKLKNTSGKPLTQGPITVYDDNTYAGDTRILDLQPGEERLLSYALDQGTEVLTATSATPGPELYFRIGEDKLATNYKVRHATTYTMKNRSTHDRTVIVEHPITAGWELLEPKAAEQSRDLYRFQVAAPAGKTIAFKVLEESRSDSEVPYARKGDTFTAVLRNDVNVKTVVKTSPAWMTALKLVKGEAVMTWHERESKTYYLQNLAAEDVHCTIDHPVRPDWSLMLDPERPKRGPTVHRVKLSVPGLKTASKEIVEERTYVEKRSLMADIPEGRMRAWSQSPNVNDDVKAGLTKLLAKLEKVRATKQQVEAANAQLKLVGDDQGRLRSNLQIIPQSSEHYKKFLEKFVAQETEIATVQTQARQLQATLVQHEREATTFAATLSAE